MQNKGSPHTLFNEASLNSYHRCGLLINMEMEYALMAQLLFAIAYTYVCHDNTGLELVLNKPNR